jgi:hypothetical protein
MFGSKLNTFDVMELSKTIKIWGKKTCKIKRKEHHNIILINDFDAIYDTYKEGINIKLVNVVL